jgi:multicomponent Na+:H+ antiporter subunit E
MRVFAVNLLLAAGWGAMTSSASLANLAFGFAVGYLTLRLSPGAGESAYFRTAPRAVRFAAFLAWDVVRSAVRVGLEVVRPRLRLRPGILAVPLTARTDGEIATLANLITLTPGTLALGISPDRRTLYVHAVVVGDPDAVRRAIRHDLERRVLELLR